MWLCGRGLDLLSVFTPRHYFTTWIICLSSWQVTHHHSDSFPPFPLTPHRFPIVGVFFWHRRPHRFVWYFWVFGFLLLYTGLLIFIGHFLLHCPSTSRRYCADPVSSFIYYYKLIHITRRYCVDPVSSAELTMISSIHTHIPRRYCADPVSLALHLHTMILFLYLDADVSVYLDVCPYEKSYTIAFTLALN